MFILLSLILASSAFAQISATVLRQECVSGGQPVPTDPNKLLGSDVGIPAIRCQDIGNGRIPLPSSNEMGDPVANRQLHRGYIQSWNFILWTPASAFRMDLPPGVTSFANLIGVPAMNALIGLAANRAPGDAGFVLFDLERGEARVMPVPEGFAQVNLLGVFTATRKLVARGIRPGGAGSQYLIYDLVTGDLLMPPNPEGVDFVGGAVQQAGGGAAPPVLQLANPRAGTIFAIGYNSERKQTGVLVVRVP